MNGFNVVPVEAGILDRDAQRFPDALELLARRSENLCLNSPVIFSYVIYYHVAITCKAGEPAKVAGRSSLPLS